MIHYANKHPRVKLHSPGPGVGGHCLAVDPWFVVQVAKDLSPIIQLSRNINNSMPAYVAERAKRLMPVGSGVLVLGCTYKPDVDDFRESPIKTLVRHLEGEYQVRIVDPFVKRYDVDVYQAGKNAELVILGVHHNKFRELDLARLGRVMKNPVLLDTRNFFSRADAEDAGFDYHLLGASQRF